jgi:hypothetical protein
MDIEPKKKISERVFDEIQRQELESQQEKAYADLPEPGHVPANPGSTFARRILQRIAQEAGQ